MLLDLGLLFLRVSAAGTLLFAHGMAKLTGFTMMAAGFPDPLGMGSKVTLAMAVFAECFCSFLVLIGLSTRLATLPVIGTMLTAFAVVHAADAWSIKELAFLYGASFLTLLLTGPGSFSVDALIKVRRVSRP